MSKFLSKRLLDLKTYIPGEQPADMEYTKLNTNESPYPPAPGVMAALTKKELKNLNLYPNPDGERLINKLARIHDVSSENVIIGNGSDELLAFSFLAFFDNGVVFPDITYGFYPVYAELYGTPYRQIPLRNDLTVEVKDYIAIGQNIVIANPNAPTGITLGLDDIEAITNSNPDCIVLIDEAYIDFGGKSAIPLTRKYDNLLVIHTYSKARSMAGARLAYAIAEAPIIEDLKKIKYSFNPYNVNRLTQLLGEAALNEESYYREKHLEIIKVREYTASKLIKLGFEMTESSANFLYVEHPDISGEQLYLELKQKGILVRQWNKPRISNHIRITIGTKPQMDTLISAVKKILGGIRL
jgi:histidinol-phosphate aminotransferase